MSANLPWFNYRATVIQPRTNLVLLNTNPTTPLLAGALPMNTQQPVAPLSVIQVVSLMVSREAVLGMVNHCAFRSMLVATISPLVCMNIILPSFLGVMTFDLLKLSLITNVFLPTFLAMCGASVLECSYRNRLLNRVMVSGAESGSSSQAMRQSLFCQLLVGSLLSVIFSDAVWLAVSGLSSIKSVAIGAAATLPAAMIFVGCSIKGSTSMSLLRSTARRQRIQLVAQLFNVDPTDVEYSNHPLQIA